MYINDMPDSVRSTVRLFADESLLYRVISSAKDATALQEDLDKLQQWEKDWLMAFNPDKCELIRITNKRKIIPATYTIHGQQLQLVDTARYLGVDIHSKLSWNPHVDHITKKANSILAFLQRNPHKMPNNIKEKCFRPPNP